MAEKTAVKVNKFAVKSIYDDTAKARILPLMQKAAEAAVKKSGKLALGEPKERGAKSWTLDGSLLSLAPDKAGKKLEGKVSMSISSSQGGIKAMPSGSAATAIRDPNKIDPGDAEAVAEACVESAMKSAVGFMEKTAP